MRYGPTVSSVIYILKQLVGWGTKFAKEDGVRSEESGLFLLARGISFGKRILPNSLREYFPMDRLLHRNEIQYYHCDENKRCMVLNNPRQLLMYHCDWRQRKQNMSGHVMEWRHCDEDNENRTCWGMLWNAVLWLDGSSSITRLEVDYPNRIISGPSSAEASSKIFTINMRFDISETKFLDYMTDTTSNVFFNRSDPPDAKSVRLSPPQLWQLFLSLETINEEADSSWAAVINNTKYDYSHHLGWGLYLTVLLYQNRRYYDIRKWWLPPGEDSPKATKIGIRLSADEMEKLRCFKSDLFVKMPELGLVEACDCYTGTEYLRCKRCSPFWFIYNKTGWENWGNIVVSLLLYWCIFFL